MKYNHNPISLREGKITIDGIEVADAVSCNIKFTPDVWTGKQLGERSSSSRWLGYTITGDITRRRTNKFLQEVINKYKEKGITPEFTIQGINNDTGSDYYEANGNIVVTAVGCVLTGDIPLMALDSNGDIMEDSISFNAYDVV